MPNDHQPSTLQLADEGDWFEAPLPALADEAEASDPPGTSVRWANATPEERERIAADAARFRAGAVESLERAGPTEAARIAAMLPPDDPRRVLYLTPDEDAPWPLDIHSSKPDVPPGGTNALRFRTARETAAELPEDVAWTHHRYIARGCLHEFVGKAKAAGKTTYLLLLTAAVLDGRPFLGQPTARGPVVYLTEQPGASLRASLVRAGLTERDDLVLLTWRDARGASWSDIVAAAIAECERIGAVLLIVDTLPQFAGIRGDAENDAGVALEAIAPLQAAVTDGLAVVVVRHERKGAGEIGESARGSSAFTGAVDVVLRLARKPDATRPTIRSLSALSRFDETPPEVMIELTDAGYIVLGEAAAIALGEAREAVLDAIDAADPEPVTRQELEAAAATTHGAKRTTVDSALAGLLADGTLARTGAGRKGDPYRYSRLHDAARLFPPPLRGGAVGGKHFGPPTAGAESDDESPAIVQCRDYRAHQADHRRVGDRFVCDVCEASA